MLMNSAFYNFIKIEMPIQIFWQKGFLYFQFSNSKVTRKGRA